ncbi:MAG: hypothetical protein SFY81_07280, partial [Verrucomicrobiota bacterium]|nr:hypothetical protein [Verrucomicrobiota bacterium]
KSIEKMLRIELAHRKQDHAERKLLLAEKKQELAARKFAFQQLKQQEKAASAVKPEEKTSPSSTAAGMESLPVAETPAAQPAENELPAPQPAPSKIVHIHYPSPATTTCDEAIPAELLA